MARFEIDERKLRSALAAVPVPRTLDDDVRALKMVGLLIAGPLLLVGSVGLIVVSLLSRL